MTKIIIFTGLSISFNEAKKILDSNENLEVVYKRPVKRGEVKLAMKENPDVIGIIDGLFHQSPSVGHKEILNAINRGITVVGGSSMGALRASELDELGMIGIGYVYNQYKTGKITSDDDVAVILDKKTLEALSDPLVNMQYIFENALDEKIISESEKDSLIKIAKKIYYPDRNYNNVFSKSELSEDKIKDLKNFISNSKDIKKEDAKSVIEHIKNLVS